MDLATIRALYWKGVSPTTRFLPPDYPTVESLREQLYHVVNHGTDHRGQVVSMLRQLGATPEATDLLVYCDQQPA